MATTKESATASFWMTKTKRPAFEPLSGAVTCEVCVIGAGITGLTTAFMLAREGRSVVVLDDGPLAGGETQRTTGHLSNAIDARYFEIERVHGGHAAQVVAASHSWAIDWIEGIVNDEHIECDFQRVDGFLVLDADHSPELLERELKATHAAGLTEVELLPQTPAVGVDLGPCLRFPKQGQFHPLRYLNGLAVAFTAAGGRIFTGTRAEDFQIDSVIDVATSTGHVVSADSVVVATNTPMNDRVVMHTKQAAYRTYAIAVAIPRDSFAPNLYWDSGDPYHYVRLQRGSHRGHDAADDFLLIGGEDHKTGQGEGSAARYKRLLAWARRRFPMVGDVVARWSGQVMETVDGLAFIGRNPLDRPNVYIATGDCGMGLTHGTIAGKVLSDLIGGRENSWAQVYDPSRISMGAGLEFVRENLNVATQYLDWVKIGSHGSTPRRGEGRIVQSGVSKRAIYRDDDGVLHQLSAVCPHLGCIVHWNAGEKTWDCPCHGSRFDCRGGLLNGPANSDLPKITEEAKDDAKPKAA